MHIRLRQRLESLFSSFWFLPGLITLLAIGLAIVMLRLDHSLAVAQWARENPVLFTSGEGARNLLATVAGSTISVAGVVFSITVLVLSMASRQFGPGLLGNFMQHRGTQVVLGAFVGSFSYCLIVLRFVHDEEGFVPHLAVNAGLLLGLISFFLLIYFIHHVSVFIRVSRVIDDVALKMERTLCEAFPERNAGDSETPDSEAHSELAERLDREGTDILVHRPGYIQVIDFDRLNELACRYDARLRMNYRPGHFIMRGAGIAKALPARHDEQFARQIAACVTIGPERSSAQDPEFAVHQLVEIALRALSPGVNDPFTAINCIDRLGAALALLATRKLPSRFIEDAAGTIRVITNPLTYDGIVQAAFNQVRQAAHGHLDVRLRLLEVMTQLGKRQLPEPFRNALRQEVESIEAGQDHDFHSEIDRREYDRRRQAALDSICGNRQ